MAAVTVNQLDDLLLSAYARLAADRQIEDAHWNTYLRTVLPEPPFYDFFARRRWRAAFAVASKIAVKTQVHTALVLPVWSNDNEDEVDRDDWRRETLFVFEDGEFLDVPGALAEDLLVVARVERAERPRVADAGWFTSTHPTRYRDPQFVVTVGDNAERVRSIEAQHRVPAVAKPTRVVPGFSADMEPAIDLDAAMPVLAELGRGDARATYREHGADRFRALIETALQAQRFTSDDDL